MQTLHCHNQQFVNILPTVHSVIFGCYIHGAISPIDNVCVVIALFVWVFQLLDFTLVSHKRVCHHAVYEKHEGGSCPMYEGAQPPHHHHHGVFPGGKSKLQYSGFSRSLLSYEFCFHPHSPPILDDMYRPSLIHNPRVSKVSTNCIYC